LLGNFDGSAFSLFLLFVIAQASPQSHLLLGAIAHVYVARFLPFWQLLSERVQPNGAAFTPKFPFRVEPPFQTVP
jgi:hypothetical protein